jgi:hypothetical protein
MAKKGIEPLKEKQRRQKILLAVLGVVFLGLVAFQGPKTWKKLHPSNVQATPSYNDRPTTTTSTPSLAAPTLGGSQSPGSGTTSGASGTTTTPELSAGQLSSFSRFASKDPFAQQVSDDAAASSGGSYGSASNGAGGDSGGSDGGSSSSGGSASAPKPGTAVISLDGTLYTVAVGTDFPQADANDPSVVPLFHLISVTEHTAKISIVGGSYANGAAAVTLQEGKPVTLMNTADGTRYKLILKPVGTAVATPSAPTSTTPTSTTPTVTVPPPASP